MPRFDKKERQNLIIIGRACIKRLDGQTLKRLITRHIVSRFDRQLFGIDRNPFEVSNLKPSQLTPKELRTLDTRRCFLVGLAVVRELARPDGEIQPANLKAILGDGELLEWVLASAPR